jgi:hypothetical protein
MTSAQSVVFLCLVVAATAIETKNRLEGHVERKGDSLASVQSYAKQWLRSERHSFLNEEHSPGLSLSDRELTERAHSSSKNDEVPPFCNKDGTVDFSNGDSFNEDAFKRKFAPICSCIDEDNTQNVVGRIDELLGSVDARTSVVTERAKEEISTIYGEQSYECINQCEVCFHSSDSIVDHKKCGIADSSYKLTYEAIDDTSTILEQVKAETFDASSGAQSLGPHLQSKFHFDFCFLYTVGAEGKVCFGTNPNGPSDSKTAVEECFVSYNGELCTSCVRGGVNATDSSCVQANCTNIVGGGMIDSCEKESTVGPFEILSQYQKRTAPLTLGACGDIQKVANHPTMAPAEEEISDVGYADASTIRVSRSPSVAGAQTLCWIALVVSCLFSSLF